MEKETVLTSSSPDVSLSDFQLNDEMPSKVTGYVTYYLNYVATQSMEFLNDKMKYAWGQLKESFHETYDNYYVWIQAHLIMYSWTAEDLDPLLEWVRSKAPGCSVTDFSSTWKNGLVLVALLEGIVPNSCCCTQHQILNPKHGVQNVELAFSIAKKYLGVSPTLSASEVTSGDISIERKLIRYIVMLRLAMGRHENSMAKPISLAPDQDPIFHGQPCLIKGMGIVVARKNKPARFNLYVKHADQMDILIEIKGPNEDFCSHRITNRSPRNQVIRSKILPSDLTECKPMNIELLYEILGRKVSITYCPVSSGFHQLNVYWQGRNLDGSPFSVLVDGSPNTPNKQIPSKIPRLLSPPNKRLYPSNKPMQKSCKLVKRKILRQVVLRNGKEIELEEAKPLPYDPTAWCGNTGLGNKLDLESPKHEDRNQENESNLDQSSASTPHSDRSVFHISFNPSPASIPIEVFAYQAANQLENVLDEKSNVEIGDVRECLGKTTELKIPGLSVSMHEILVPTNESDQKLQRHKSASLNDLTVNTENKIEKKPSPVNTDNKELKRNAENENYRGNFNGSYEPYNFLDSDDYSFESDVSGGILNEGFHKDEDSRENSFGSFIEVENSNVDFGLEISNSNELNGVLCSTVIESKESKDNSNKSVNESELSFKLNIPAINQNEEDNQETQFSIGSLTRSNIDVSSNSFSLVKIRVQEWEDTISKYSP